MDVQMTMNLAFGAYLEEQNKRRIKEQEKLYYYYVGEQDKVIRYLEKALSITFDERDIEEFQLNYLNVTKKIINALAVVYRDPAYRYFKNEYDQKADKRELTNYYNSILPENINSKDKQINRYAKLFNTALTQVGFDNKTGKIIYNNRGSHQYDVIVDEDNIYRPLEVRYKQYMTLKGKPELVTIVWTEGDHYGLTSLGNDFAIGENKDKINPYGILPFAVLREEEQDDFWGNGQYDLVNANEQINFLMTDLINGGVIMQSWGTPVAVNLGLHKKTESGEDSFSRLRFGVKHPIVVEGVRSDMQKPELEYKNANPLIKEVKDVIDWQFTKVALMKGLDPNRIIGKLTDASGFAKIVDAIEQNELRRDSLEPCREYEKQRFEITRRVNNYFAETKEGRSFNLRKIKEDVELAVDFAEIKPPIDAETQILVDDFYLKRNVISVLDVIRRENPDLDDEQLKKLLAENKELNDKYVPAETAQNNVDNIRKQKLSDKMVSNKSEVE